jgi:hypothetical protein
MAMRDPVREVGASAPDAADEPGSLGADHAEGGAADEHPALRPTPLPRQRSIVALKRRATALGFHVNPLEAAA